MLTAVVLIAAPAAPLTMAKTTLLSIASWGSMAANASATEGDARNARNPIANPIDPKIASTAVLDAMFSHC